MSDSKFTRKVVDCHLGKGSAPATLRLDDGQTYKYFVTDYRTKQPLPVPRAGDTITFSWKPRERDGKVENLLFDLSITAQGESEYDPFAEDGPAPIPTTSQPGAAHKSAALPVNRNETALKLLELAAATGKPIVDIVDAYHAILEELRAPADPLRIGEVSALFVMESGLSVDAPAGAEVKEEDS